VDQRAWVTTFGFRARRCQWGKHRTEVTEVTEGELGWWTEGLGEHLGFLARTKASHRGGLRLVDGSALMKCPAPLSGLARGFEEL
jgi:hypothetical protein